MTDGSSFLKTKPARGDSAGKSNLVARPAYSDGFCTVGCVSCSVAKSRCSALREHFLAPLRALLRIDSAPGEKRIHLAH